MEEEDWREKRAHSPSNVAKVVVSVVLCSEAVGRWDVPGFLLQPLIAISFAVDLVIVLSIRAIVLRLDVLRLRSVPSASRRIWCEDRNILPWCWIYWLDFISAWASFSKQAREREWESEGSTKHWEGKRHTPIWVIVTFFRALKSESLTVVVLPSTSRRTWVERKITTIT